MFSSRQMVFILILKMKDRKQAARVLEANPTQCAQSNYDVLKTLNSVGEEYRDSVITAYSFI